MKILFVARSTLFHQPGGDTVQVQQTAHFLRQKGVEVHIGLAGENLPIEQFELVHFFNLIRPADLLPYLNRAQHLVVSSIYIDYSSYDRHHHHGLGRIIAAFSGKHGLEYLKTTARWVKGQEIFPGFSYLSLGQRGAIRKILTKAKKIITASTFEKELIQHDFKDVADQHFAKVNLGTEHFNTNPGQPQRAVACVARIEGLKNQYHLIKALANLDIPLHLYGQAAKHQPAYYKMCRSVSGNNISFKGYQSQKELAKLLPQYKVHALPSYYETTGLSSLEALKAGCQVVVSNRGSQPQIFGEHAHYCDPAAPTSIAEAVKKAMYTRGNHVSWVKENFSWEKSAHEILDIYNKIIHPI